MKFKKENEMTIKEKIERIENKIDSENKDNILVFYSIFIWDMYLNRMNSVFQSSGRIIFNIFRSLISKNKKNNEKYEGAFFSFLARDADFGIIYPIVKKFDKNKRKNIYFITKDCYISYKTELLELKNTEIVIINKAKNRLNLKEIIVILKIAYKNYNILKKLDMDVKKFKYNYLHREIANRIASNGINKRYQNIKYFFSLGAPIVKLIAGNRRVFAIQHGFFSKTEPNYPWFYKFNTDIAYVLGNKDLELGSMYKDTKIIPMGNPFYDSIFIENSNNIEEKKQVNICFFSSLQGKNYLEKDVFEFLFEILEVLKNDIFLTIKLHPNETEEIYKKYKEKLKDKAVIKNGKVTIQEIIEKQDICISIDSTACIEALVCNKIVCQFLNEKNQNYIERQEFAKRIRNSKEMINFILKIKNNEKFQNRILKFEKMILEKYYLKNLGNSSQKIYENVLLQLLKMEEKENVK
ncbi:hypothetical protein [Fusobacterium ulcerans]|uniref:hypothetical protein n=1 Tax=Fusobacterium ulcerans TaxID=861 RepID=UPI00241EC6D4|nr:hypothetical protein [Fusobacterium ulcerans]